MQAAVADVLRVLTIVFGGVLAGIVVSEHVIILPLVRAAAPGVGVSGLRFAGARAWRLAPACGVTAGLSGAALVAVWPWNGFSAAGVLTALGLLLFVTAVVVTFAWYYPIDSRVRSLTHEAAVVEAASSFETLARRHLIRAAFYTAAFVCFVVGAVLR
jgi:hypothetical protein